MTARSVVSASSDSTSHSARRHRPQPARAVWGGLLLLALALFAGGPARASEPSVALIDRLNTGMLEIMRRADELGFQGRVTAFEILLADTYNLRIMAKVAVGRQWRSLDDARKDQLVAAFTAMTVATYANRFKGYSGESFEIDGSEPSIRGMVLVKSRLMRGNGEAVDLNYLTKSYRDGWRIVDVYLEAKYSELARLRAEFASIIAKEGYDGLIRRIEERTAEAAPGQG